jgi:undecaprenyl pyrophosphate synthase
MADLLGSWYRDAVGAVLRRTGPIPRHVAFIMDGNRRYARQRGLIGGARADGSSLLSSSSSRVVEGHRAGYAAMVDAVGWCLSLGVTHVTLYAFSLDNYGRAPEEVADLMGLAATKYGELAAAEGFKGKGGAVKGGEGDVEKAEGGGAGEADRSRRRRSRSCGGGGKKRCGSGGRRRRRRRQDEQEQKLEDNKQPASKAPAAARPPPPQNNANASWRGAEVRILGNLDTAPTSVRQAAARLMRATRAYGLGEDEEDEEESSDGDDDDDSSSGSEDEEEEEDDDTKKDAAAAATTAEQPQPGADSDDSDDGFDARAEALLHGEPGPLPPSRLNSPLGSARYDSPSGSSPPASASPLPPLSLSPAPSPPNKGQRRYRPSASARHQPQPQPQRRRRRRPPIVNICFAYTSTDELRAAVTDVRSALKRLQLLPGDVDARLLLAAMHTRECPPVDLVLRTSGEQRLSDFVVWQASCAQVQVLPCLWPEITFARLARCFALYQRHAKEMGLLRAAVAQGGGAPAAVVEVRDSKEGEDDEEGGGGYHALGLPMSASLLDEGGGGGGAAGAGGGAAAAGPPQRTSSFLSSISEDEPTLAPHPHVALRVAGFLRSLDARRGAWVARHTR